MKPQDLPSTATDAARGTDLEQVFLIERDPGLLCRILGLYAARGLDVEHAGYTYAAQHVMRLDVRVAGPNVETAEAIRVLVDKVATIVGVIAAADRHPPRAGLPSRP